MGLSKSGQAYPELELISQEVRILCHCASVRRAIHYVARHDVKPAGKNRQLRSSRSPILAIKPALNPALSRLIACLGSDLLELQKLQCAGCAQRWVVTYTTAECRNITAECG